MALDRTKAGYFQGLVHDVAPGDLYFFLLDGRQKRPDPASRRQPSGVHGPSQIVDTRAFQWSDSSWRGRFMAELVIYELHVGVFTQEGTFGGVLKHLEYLAELGITAIELMPVAQFPGTRNWGYDGVYPYAVQNSYGGPDGLRRLVDACHRRGLAVLLDVVYNHLGPEGNYLSDFGPYFTDRYRTPWGSALNFDGPDSGEVRRFFIDNALFWIDDFHIDGLRLDAVHAIVDTSAFTFLEELAAAVHRRADQLGRRVHVIAESDRNDARLIRPNILGGYGLDAIWSDDFHHCLHTILTGERNGYYRDFGTLRLMSKTLREGYAYTGQYSAYRRRRHGNRPRGCSASQFVVFAQNHDQVGNRARGERLGSLVSFSDLKLAAGMVLLSPFVPLLFMGEEYGETAPFQYFVSHTDPDLIEAVRKGRREEFAGFRWADDVPDPQAETTFSNSRLNHDLRAGGRHAVLVELYRELLRLRREIPALAVLARKHTETFFSEPKKVMLTHRRHDGSAVCAVFSFNDQGMETALPFPPGQWKRVLDTAAEQWLGDGKDSPDVLRSTGEVPLLVPPKTFVLYEQLKEAY